MERKTKIIPFEIKDINEEERSFLAVASTEDIDRDNDRIMADGWDLDNFLKNPVIPWAHRYGEPPVAQAAAVFVEEGKLKFRPRFATADEYPFADNIYKLYKGGFLRSFSVGFNPRRFEIVEREKGRRGYDFIEQELWEISACTVPSNPNALVEAKSKGIIDDVTYGKITDEMAINYVDCINTRLNIIDEKLKTIDDYIKIPKGRTPDDFEPMRLDDIERKLDQLLETLTKQPETLTLVSSETELDAEKIADVIRKTGDAQIQRIGDLVDKRIKYHLGKVD